MHINWNQKYIAVDVDDIIDAFTFVLDEFDADLDQAYERINELENEVISNKLLLDTLIDELERKGFVYRNKITPSDIIASEMCALA